MFVATFVLYNSCVFVQRYTATLNYYRGDRNAGKCRALCCETITWEDIFYEPRVSEEVIRCRAVEAAL